MFKKIFVVFIIISSLAIIGSAESGKQYGYTEFHNYSPAYTIIPMPNEVIVNKGRPASIDLYVSGLGLIKENKILLRIPPKLLDSENPGEIAGSIKCRGSNRTNFESKIETHFGDISNMRIVLNECNFMAVPEETVAKPTRRRAPILLSERDNADNQSNYPPINIRLNISDDAPVGDQYVYLVFTYTDGTKWYQDKEKIKIHVNSFYERFYVSHLIIVGVLVALFGQLIVGLYGSYCKSPNCKK